MASMPPEGYVRAGGPPAVPSDSDRNWAVAAHAGSFVAAWVALGLLAPLIVLLTQGPASPFVRHHAVESLNFQINALFWLAVSGVLVLVAIGLPMLLVVGVWYAVFVILASVRASRGEWYRYPMILRLVR